VEWKKGRNIENQEHQILQTMFPTMNGQVDEMDNTSHEEPTTSSNSSCPLSVVSIPGLGVPQSLANALRRIEVPQLDAIPILLGEADALITPIRGRERYTDDDSSLTVPHTVHTATKFPHLSRRWPSRLMRLISEKSNDDEWSAVMERLQSHPEEIAIKGPANGMNAFHAACVRYPPLHVISAMIAVSNPETIGAANANGETPLHLAADGASEDVQMLLIDCAPKAALAQDKYGDCPLHFAARSGATRHLMQALVQAAPESISIANPRGVTPFSLLPRTFLEAEDLDEIFDDESDNFRDDWDLHVLFLSCSYVENGYTVPEFSLLEEDYRTDRFQDWIVHAAAVTAACPRQVLTFLCRMFPDQALRRNEKGFTPLLLATQTPAMDEPDEWNENEDGYRAEIDAVEGRLQIESHGVTFEEVSPQMGDSAFIYRSTSALRPGLKSKQKDSVIDILLRWSPRSIICEDVQGRLPLAHALVSGHSWHTVRSIIAACPRALEVRDRATGLYMCQLSSIHSPDLDTVYTIVRSHPHFLRLSGNFQAGRSCKSSVGN
jgi:ankyrin repeat protein